MNSVENCAYHLDKSTAVQMTSRDLNCDINARLDVAASALRNKTHVNFFRNLIFLNKHLFRGRIVLDIGCGIGILSLFAAKSGAARVYAIDDSNIVDYTKAIVYANKLDHIIQVIKGKIQLVELPEKVDIIVSDWMGDSLIYQSLCEWIIFARDKWLKADTGIILPDLAELSICVVEDRRIREERFDWWRNVYGFNMKFLRKFALSEPTYHKLKPSQILSTSYIVKKINLNTIKYEDLRFRNKFCLNVLRTGNADAIMTSFKVFFSKSHVPTYLRVDGTSIDSKCQHNIFFFEEPVFVRFNTKLYGGFEMVPSRKGPENEEMRINFELLHGLHHGEMDVDVVVNWRMRNTYS